MKILIVCIVLIIGFLGLSYGPVMTRANFADRTENISHMRTIQTALLGYYAKHDNQYPNSLEQLVSEKLNDEIYYLDKKHLKLIDIDLYYVPNLDAYDNEKIILYTTVGESGKAIAGYVDGSVMAIDPEELNRLLIKQGLSPIEIIAQTP